MVSGGEQRADGPVEHEVGPHGSLDRLGHLRVGGVNQVAESLADIALPVRQRVDVVIDPLIFVVIGN
jgi:hypothetical protein